MSRIRIGNQTAFSASTPEMPFDFAVTHGFDAFEWFPDRSESGAGWCETDITRERRTAIRETAIAHDVNLSVHAPWWANPLNPDALGILNQSIDFAKDIGASLFNVHLYINRGTAAYVEAIAPLIDRLKPFSMKLSIENTPLTGPDDFRQLFRELEEQGFFGPQVGMCLDVGHANLCAATRNDYLKFMDRIAPDIPVIHVHLHENFGDRDSHLTVFSGPSALDSSGIESFLGRMIQRRFSGSIILEQWPEPPELLLHARNRLIEMIGGRTSPTADRE